MSEQEHRILIVGTSAAGAHGLPHTLLKRIRAADLLAGGARHLAYFPEHSGETLVIGASVEPLVERLLLAQARGERAVVLASGDPLWYGIGASLRRTFAPEALEIVPAPASFQLAFAALGEPWHDAALLSAHARPLAEVIAALRHAAKAAVLTDNQHTPQVVARALLADGHRADTPCAICENLGGAAQRVVRTTLHDAAKREFALLNVFVVWVNERDRRHETGDARRETGDTRRDDAMTRDRNDDAMMGDARYETRDAKREELLTASSPHASPPGLPDSAFATGAAQITKREVRLLSLAELALQPGETLWDIGAGSGSVAIEAARATPTAHLFAVERRAAFVAHIAENLRRFPAPNVAVIEGVAPAACAELPAPHAVFIGGSGGQLREIVALARERLHTGGRLVLNVVTLENLHTLRALLPEASVYQAQISRGVPIQDMLRFEALNPVWIVVWRKP